MTRADGADDGARGAGERAERGVGTRALLTLVLVLATCALRKTQMPGVDGKMLPFHVGELGILPVTSGFLTVEFFALLVPRWRKLRHDGLGRRRLDRAAEVMTVVLSLFQSFGVAMWLEALAVSDPTMEGLYTGSRLVTMITLSAGAAIYLLVANLITRVGVCNGVSILLVVESAFRMKLTGENGPLTASAVAPGAALCLFGAAIVGLLMMGRRAAESDGVSTWRPRLPASGIFPVNAALALPAFFASLDNFESTRNFIGEFRITVSLQLAVAAALAFPVTYAFNAPPVVEDVARRLGTPLNEPRTLTAIRRAAISSVLLSLLIVGIPSVLGASLAYVDIVTAMVLVAVSMDLRAELGFRSEHGAAVTVLRLHRVCTADLALEALESEGIPAAARGLFHRTLLQFFGPFVPVEILVPKVRELDAREILGGLEEAESDGEVVPEPVFSEASRSA